MTDVNKNSTKDETTQALTTESEKVESNKENGSISFRTNPDDPLEHGKRVVWRQIYAEVPIQTQSQILAFIRRSSAYDYRVVLDKVSGIAHPGHLTFIMGASGAGKTTLLNILTQRNMKGIRVYGEVLVNRHPISAQDMRKISAYVQQEDLFIGELTVRETIAFAVNMKMGKKHSRKAKRDRIEEVISSMGLTICQNTKIGGKHVKSISRGEKKRLAFACEIITDPPILFCDEPTSGLDSFMAKQVITIMKKLATGGKTVISTIHQPSSQVYEMADSLILMAGGLTAYHGPANQVLDFFKSSGFPLNGVYMNPADHFMRVLSLKESETDGEHRDRIEKIAETYASSKYGLLVERLTQNLTPNTQRRRIKENYSSLSQYKTSWCCQTWLLFVRAFLCLVRNPMVLQVRLFQVIICSLVIGSLFLQTKLRYDTIQNYMGVLYNNVRDMNFMFVFPCISVFTTDLPVIVREYKSSMYYPTAYFLGKNLADTIQYIIFPLIYSLIIYFMAFNLSDITLLSSRSSAAVVKFFYYALTNIAMATTATSIGYAAACIFGSLEVAVQILPLMVVPLLALGGLFINLRSVPRYFSWIEHVSYYRFAFEAHIDNMLGDVIYIPGCNKTRNEAYCHQNLTKDLQSTAPSGGEGPTLMHFLKMRTDFYWLDITFLMVTTIILRLIAVVALQIRVSLK